jgi:hypothetical protein
MSIRVAEPLGRSLLAFANLPPVDDEVVIVRDAVDLYGTERVLLETHLGSAPSWYRPEDTLGPELPPEALRLGSLAALRGRLAVVFSAQASRPVLLEREG